VEHFKHIIEDFTVSSDMKIVEINLTGPNNSPVRLIISVVLYAEFKSYIKALNFNVCKVEHLELANLKTASKMSLKMCASDFHHSSWLILARDNLDRPVFNVESGELDPI